MIVMCVEDGLTVGNRVYYKGECFKLAEVVQSLFGDSSDEQSSRKQIRVYGKVYFRKATVEEMIEAKAMKTLSHEMLDVGESRLVHQYEMSAKPAEEEESLVSPVMKAQFEAEDVRRKEQREELIEAKKKLDEEKKQAKETSVKAKSTSKKPTKKTPKKVVEEERSENVEEEENSE